MWREFFHESGGHHRLKRTSFWWWLFFMLFLLLIQYSMKLDPVTRRLPIESFSLTSTKSLGNCSPTRHEVVMIYISKTSFSSRCWKFRDTGMSHRSFGGWSFYPRCLNFTITSTNVSAILIFGFMSCFQAPQQWCWGNRPPIQRLLVIFFLFSFFFFFNPTDPISGNAFDAKRRKKRDGLRRVQAARNLYAHLGSLTVELNFNWLLFPLLTKFLSNCFFHPSW